MTNAPAKDSQWSTIASIAGIALALVLTYAPLLVWLGRVSYHVTQLSTGAVLVLFSMLICLQTSLRTLRVEPAIHSHGLALVGLGLFFLWLPHHISFPPLPLVIFSFCLSLAGLISFVFGNVGVRQFLPALGGFLVFGLLVGLFPALDWPLRAIAAKYAAAFMTWLGLPVELHLVLRGPPELVLTLQGHSYTVATECNGFGLLTSTLLFATILVFQYRLPVINKVGLLCLAVPIAIGCNFLRIVSICYSAPRVPFSYHVVHEVLGNIFYFAGLALVWLSARRAAAPANDELPSTSANEPRPRTTAHPQHQS